MIMIQSIWYLAITGWLKEMEQLLFSLFLPSIPSFHAIFFITIHHERFASALSLWNSLTGCISTERPDKAPSFQRISFHWIIFFTFTRKWANRKCGNALHKHTSTSSHPSDRTENRFSPMMENEKLWEPKLKFNSKSFYQCSHCMCCTLLHYSYSRLKKLIERRAHSVCRSLRHEWAFEK